jgi:hypothetical protein
MVRLKKVKEDARWQKSWNELRLIQAWGAIVHRNRIGVCSILRDIVVTSDSIVAIHVWM